MKFLSFVGISFSGFVLQGSELFQKYIMLMCPILNFLSRKVSPVLRVDFVRVKNIVLFSLFLLY